MYSLLQNDFIAYLKSKDTRVVSVCPDNIRMEVIADSEFDIKDKAETIGQPAHTGSATYNNPERKKITFLDYEHFLNLQPKDVIKRLDLKKPDFIVYDGSGKTFFIVNELSQGSADNKRTTAIQQMHNAVFNFDRVPNIKSYIEGFDKKICIFSNRENPIRTPEGVADDFFRIDGNLPEPIVHEFQPIAKLGYKLIETSVINV